MDDRGEPVLAGLGDMRFAKQAMETVGGTGEEWFVMRDLKRANALVPAYKELASRGFEVFTPMEWRVSARRGKKLREEVPVLRDLLFVHSRRTELDPFVAMVPTLQYRYVRGAYRLPMTVPAHDMERFIRAAGASESPRYFLPGELTLAQCGRMVSIVGGPLDGYCGRLLSVRGSKSRRLVVELPGILMAAVEVDPEYIRVL